MEGFDEQNKNRQRLAAITGGWVKDGGTVQYKTWNTKYKSQNIKHKMLNTKYAKQK